MRSLIIGGTAFIGPHIVRELHAEDHQVFVFNRGQTTSPLLEDVERISGDRQHRIYEYLKCMDDCRPAILFEEGLPSDFTISGIGERSVRPSGSNGSPNVLDERARSTHCRRRT